VKPDEKTPAAAAAEFNRLSKRSDGARVVVSLDEGLSVLRSALLTRIHGEVEQRLGVDSMLMPLSELRTRQQSDLETDLYQVAECTIAERESGYLPGADAWFPGWLTRLRFAFCPDETHAARVAEYLALSADERRLRFSDVLAHVVPESRRAPLVLFRLFPPAVQIVAQMAFEDRQAAAQTRARQRMELPAISDCPACRGRVLDNGQQCADCGNPLWKSHMLTRAD